MSKRRGLDALALVAVTVAYVAAGRLGLSLAFVHESASAVWPPTGIALAALIVIGLRCWPAVLAGAFLVNITASGALPALFIAAGNTLEGVTGAWLVGRYARGTAAFDRAGDILRFTLLAGLCATAIAASVGTLTLAGAGLAAPAEAPSIWLTWWLGDAVGAVVIAPLLILWSARGRMAWSRAQALEALALAGGLLGVAVAVFGPTPAGLHRYPLEFLAVPFLLWAAFRFGSREVTASVTLLATVAIYGTLNGYGPFARSSANESLLLLQAFVGVLAMVMLVVAAEISARRTAALVRAHDRLTEAQQVAHVGSWEWEIPSDALWWSGELYRIYGIDPGLAATYEGFLSRVHPDDRAHVDAAVRRAMGDGRPFGFEHRIVRPDGTIRWLEAEGRVLREPGGRPVRMFGTAHDITDRKRAEDERAQLIREQAARREAEEASRAKDQFLATLSHELRTPLNAALGWARMLLDASDDESRRMRAAAAIYRNLVIQARLVSDIMDMSLIRMGTMRLEAATVDLPGVVEAALDMVREAAAVRRIRIDTRRTAEPVEVQGDAARLQQVVWNLLSNAVKFTREGGNIVVSVACASDSAVLVVEDDGPGIDPAFLPYAFEQFRQADASVTRAHGGLGLGLAIARHIVELHGGSIAAENRAGGGATVTVRLPVVSISRSAVAAAPADGRTA